MRLSNTSTSNDKAATDEKVKLIIGEIGRDTKTGIIGRGYSFDNGKTFHVTDTIYGRVFDENDADAAWNNGMHDKVKDKINQEIDNTVTPAIKQADEAVKTANDAIEKSKVNENSIREMNNAVSDAISDAAVAKSDGMRAWEAAQSNVDLIDSNYASASAAISDVRTEAIAAADEAKKSATAAQADIKAVRSDVAAVQADVTATKSDVAVAKSDIAVAKTDLASQATSLSSYASQAAAAGKDITALKSQAGQFEQDMADTKGDVSQLKVSAKSASAALSDAAGNISSLQASAKSYSAALSDTNSNVATVTATASELETKYADAAGDIAQLQTDAKGTTQTLSDAQGDIAKLKTRADGFDTEFATANGDITKLKTDARGTSQTLTNAKSDIAVLQSRADGFDTKYADVAGDINTIKVDASGMKQTLTDAQGNISTLQATATGLKHTLTDAQGNISTLQTDVTGLKKTTSDHASNIATLQADAKTLTNQMSSAQGDISTLKQTASGFSSKVSGMETSLANANSKINNLVTSGRNYVQNSESITMYPNGADNYDLVWYVYNDAFASNTYCHGNNKTRFSFYLKPSKALSTARTFPIYWRAVPWTSFGTITVPANTTDTQYYELTMTTPTSQPIASQIFIRFMAQDTSDISYTITKSMLTIGDSFPDWSPAPEDTDAKITTNSTAAEQNKKAIALKADQTTVDKTNGTVQQLQAQLNVQADQISGKVSSSDLDAKGYATQTYTQTLVKQTADTWNLNLTNVKNDEVKDVANLNASIDGIKADVYNKDGSSKTTQLFNLIATKVSSGDYNSQIAQFKNAINLRVQKGNVVSQINQEAGGNTLIQVSGGKGKLALNASSVIFSGSAFIPDAYISTLNADKLRFYDSSGNVATMSAGLEQYDDDKTNKTIVLQYSGGYEVHASNLLGSILTMHDNTIRLAVKANGMASSGNVDQYSGVYVMQHYAQLSNYRSNGSAPGIYITDDGYTIKGDSTGSGTKWGDLNITSPQIYVTGGNSVSLSGSNAVQMQVNKTHAWLSDGMLHLYKDNDSSSTATELRVEGWAWVNGWVEAAGHSQHSALSTKTDIQSVDDDKMLKMVNDTDLATFLYKTDVANGETHRHIGLIIDDVHDVAQYQTPQDFIAPNGVSRDDDNMIGALFGAVKALTKRIKTLENKVG